MFQKLFKILLRHKIVISIIIIVLAVAGYFGFKTLKGDTALTRYVLAAAEKGTLITSVSGSGQISVLNQVEVKSKVSGDVLDVTVKNGQEVNAETVLAQIDSRDAQKAVSDARTALETARMELNKLLAPPDEIDVLQAENDLATAKRNLEELINPDESDLLQAENSLTVARDSLTKLKFSQESSYQNAVSAKQKAEDDLEKTYGDAFNTIANAFLNLPTIITKLDDMLNSYEISTNESSIGGGLVVNSDALMNSTDLADRDALQPFQTSAESDYETARSKYDTNFDHYNSISRYSDQSVIEDLLAETLETVKSLAQSAKSESNYLDAWADYRSQAKLSIFSKVKEYQTSLATYIGQTNSHLSSLLSAQRTLQDDREAIASAERDLKEMDQNQPLDLAAAERNVQEEEESLAELKNPEQHEIEAAQIAVKEKELALEELKAGADALDIRAKKIVVQQKEDALLAAQQDLEDYYIHAPFDGIVTEINIKKGESISSATVVATLITKQKIAEVSLNEVDVAKIKVGQKTTLTFDAVEGLSITGEVAEVDTLGTVTQGVVTYNVKIIFDTQDERVKPGMSVSAAIITETKLDVLLVPNSAVKSSGDINYVEMTDETVASNQSETNGTGIVLEKPPRQQQIQIGSANDSLTEVTSGLKEGDQVITKTITANTATTKTQSGGGFGIPGLGGGGGPP